MNWRAMRAIISKDLRVVIQNKGVSIPLIVLPLIIVLALPLVMTTAMRLVPETGASEMSDLQTFLAQMPPSVQQEIAGLDETQTFLVFFLVYFFGPLYLILPMMVASVIAADSFAGEKERKTLEALLYTPTTDEELFLAKLLAAWLPGIAVAWLSFAAYALVVNLSAWPLMERIFFPNTMWWVLALWVAPAVAGMGLGTVVLVSMRAQGFQDAYQISGIVVLPILALIIGQITGVLYLTVAIVFYLGLAIWVIDAVLIWFGTQIFARNALISRL